jgi:hypothetical protein
MEPIMHANRNNKDSVFSALFSDPEILRELYSAIEGVDISPDAVISINTLSEALFMKQINDLSFTIDDRLVVLIEHQSTINENIPLRILMYIARVYEKIIEKKNIYHRKLLKIPAPCFIVLYNGKEELPDHQELRLSASFKDIASIKANKNQSIPLELVVQVYNINQGRNPEMMKRSENLNGYSIFMMKIKDYNNYLPLDQSVKSAVKYCIEHDILREFLNKQGSEVFNMLFYDFSVEEIAEIRGDERYEEGLELGQEQGHKDEKLIIARNLLSKGSTLEFIQEITGLDPDIIKSL